MKSPIHQTVAAILESAIGKRAMPKNLTASTPLLGSIAELDSMAVLAILTQIQEDLGCEVADDEVSAEIFETFGNLCDFVQSKVAG